MERHDFPLRERNQDRQSARPPPDFLHPPARVRLNASKDSRMTRELDFVISHEGKWGVLEVDGPFHVPAADAERDALLRAHGITSIQRFPSLRCFQEPGSVVDEFL